MPDCAVRPAWVWPLMENAPPCASGADEDVPGFAVSEIAEVMDS
jgi:hypothetical protein